MIQDIFKKQSFPRIFKLISLLFFILFLFALYFGSIKLLNVDITSKITLLIVWTLWWPFLYVTLLFFARAWCGFLCPLSLANEVGSRFRKGKTINVLKWSFIAYIIFFFVVFLEQTSGLFLSVNATLIFFGIFFITAFIFGLVFSRWSFCRFICPIGTLLGVFSRLSFIGLRTQLEKCRVCKTRDCLVGTKTIPCPMLNNVPAIKSNADCLLCLNCIKNCPYDSPRIKFVHPGKEVVDEINFSRSESFFIVALIGLTFILNARGTQLFRKLIGFFGFEIKGSLLRLTDFVLAIGLSIVAFIILSYLTSLVLKINYREGLKKFGYLYLPLTFSIMFFTIVFGFLAPYINLNELMIAYAKYIILFVGALWSLHLCYKIIYQKYKQCRILGSLIQAVIIVIIMLFFITYLIPGPLNLFPVTERTHILQPGEALEMRAFSMGFDPAVLVVQKGEQVVIDLSNDDITHAFDIDAFDVHNIILGGKTTKIMFTPNKVGEFVFYCNIPGHTEAGMKGTLIVKD